MLSVWNRKQIGQCLHSIFPDASVEVIRLVWKKNGECLCLSGWGDFWPDVLLLHLELGNKTLRICHTAMERLGLIERWQQRDYHPKLLLILWIIENTSCWRGPAFIKPQDPWKGIISMATGNVSCLWGAVGWVYPSGLNRVKHYLCNTHQIAQCTAEYGQGRERWSESERPSLLTEVWIGEVSTFQDTASTSVGDTEHLKAGWGKEGAETCVSSHRGEMRWDVSHGPVWSQWNS